MDEDFPKPERGLGWPHPAPDPNRLRAQMMYADGCSDAAILKATGLTLEDRQRLGDAPAPKAVPPSKGIELSDEQKAIVGAVENRENVLITGPAGTGKSTLVKAMSIRFRGDFPITASTGIAAVGIGGLTLHSWAGLGIGDHTAKQIAGRIRADKNKAFRNITSYTRLVIDEVSMISANLFTKLDHIFRSVRRSDKPFGGMQLVLCGDFLQLPPVIRGQEWDGFAFESPSWAEAKIKVALLTKIFRQEDREFAQALNDIRVGNYTPLVSQVLNSRYRKEDPSPEIEPVIVHTHNVDVDDINRLRLNQIPGEPISYTAVDEGRPSAVAMLDKNCLAAKTVYLKIGAQVMLLFNLEPESGLANGSLGKVVACHPSNVEVKFANGETRMVETNSWEIKEDDIPIASRRQIPLRLAYAITVHKTQGMTLDKVKVMLARVFEDGQAYVALSRSRTLEGLFIESGNKASIRTNAKAMAFYENAEKIIYEQSTT